ncbi:MAG: type IV toxin-antitoxin system AbiEi family antitoxin domain-containing protein [Candidatus Omnitrophica bacterium]|nr:type IV toxin-antitoxin system AbiEi family antitoxin domain-containing protein [Candidatus Omnitrophota bacterium]
MVSKTKKLITFFKRQKGIARFSAVLKAGFHPDTLLVLEKERVIEKIGRGLYKLQENSVLSNPDLVVAALQVPKGVVCLVSALSFHEVTDEVPHYVDLAIPRGARANKIDFPPIKYYRFTFEAWKAGIEEHRIDGHIVRIYSLAKTIADCFKFRNKIGVQIAREALKVAVTEKKAPPKEIMWYAKICRVTNIIKPILEAII